MFPSRSQWSCRRSVDPSLERCLRALLAQTRAPDQIIVACRADDRLSRDSTARLAREVPIIQLMTCEQPKLCAQMDLGVRAAVGDVVALTDDDSVPTPAWAEHLMGLYRDPSVGAVGGRDVISDPLVDSRPVQKPVGVVTRSGRALANHHREGVGVRDVDFLKGVNLSVRRQLWHVDLALFGDGNQSHWELGTCLRIRRLGWRVLYDAELLVEHHPDARVGEPQRGSRDAYSIQRDAHNELYELVRWLPAWQSLAAILRALLVGSKQPPAWPPESGLRRMARDPAMRWHRFEQLPQGVGWRCAHARGATDGRPTRRASDGRPARVGGATR